MLYFHGMNLAPITKKDLLYIFILWSVVILIFYPLFSAEYVYTDEIVQLWEYRKGSNSSMFTYQGRLFTNWLFKWLFSSATTIKDITYIRIFSLAGWMLSIPVWYVVIKRIIAREKLPEVLTFFSLFFLICSAQFCIYVSWAACLQLFIANTAGLLAGYCLYIAHAEWKENRKKAIYLGALSVIAAQVSLFTYQSGFGCFLLPFLLHFIKEGKLNRKIIMAAFVYLLMYGLYYLFFKLSLTMTQVGASERTDLVIDPLGKLKFLVLKVMSLSFHFNYIMNENDKFGKIIYRILLGVWLITNFIQQKKNTIAQRIAFPFLIVLLWGLIYLPSLIVKENYASNRTLLALNMSVFFLVMHSMIKAISWERVRKIVVIGICTLFVINAWYNFNKLFLKPVTKEYKLVSGYIRNNYRPTIDTVYFVRPPENLFVSLYGITRSWDEFGVPSTFFGWVPEILVKQVVFEKINDRALADHLIVKHWIGQVESFRTVIPGSDSSMVVNVPLLLSFDSLSTPGSGKVRSF